MSEPDYFSQEASARRRAWRQVRAERPELFTDGGPDPEPAPIVVTAASPSASDVTRNLPRSDRSSTSPIIPLLMIGFGGYLMWFAIKYWRGTGPAVWPSYPIKSVLQGKGTPAASPAPTTAATLATYEATLPTGGTPNPAGPGPVPPPSGGGGQPQNVARLLLGGFGWTADQMAPLISLWNGESGWNPQAKNPSSGALGIAQALGHGSPATAGSLGNEYGAEYGLTVADAKAANSGSALQQIRWGLGYIKSRYGSPAAAYAAWSARSPHWY